jgi:hypothetical protein
MIRYGLQWHALQDYLAFEETANSSAWGLGGTGVPPANHVFLYAKDKSAVSALYFKNDAGVETEIPSGTIVTGSGVSGRVAFWNGTSSLSSDADMTFSVDTLSSNAELHHCRLDPIRWNCRIAFSGQCQLVLG